jgi:hypothetical protein
MKWTERYAVWLVLLNLLICVVQDDTLIWALLQIVYDVWHTLFNSKIANYFDRVKYRSQQCKYKKYFFELSVVADCNNYDIL